MSLSSELELPGLRSSTPLGPKLCVSLAEPEELDARTGSEPGAALWTTYMDDAQAIRLERRPSGDLRFDYGRRAAFLLTRDGDAILCAPVERSEPWWKRFLLDTVLATASLVRGFGGLHASSVEAEAGVLVFLAETGGGKTSMAFELVRRGGALFCDDILALGRGPTGVVAHPGPSLMNVPLAACDRDIDQPPARSLAVLGDERWLEVPGPHAPARRPAAIFLLHRDPQFLDGISRLERSPLPLLLAHSLGNEVAPGDARMRFELLADLAADVPLYRLEAPPSASPEALADVVEETLAPSRPSLAKVGA